MEEWVVVNKVFPTEEKARKASNIISVTESRLLSSPNGAQYDIETEVLQTGDGWQVRWRKVFAGIGGGCSGCGSCNSGPENRQDTRQGTKPGKVLEFRPRSK
ncbi:MAG TPA: hypothetical protein VNT57_03485 [Desulfobacteria bacterium]|nr:hypothetical protein [Desulfobacteria bacterium]